MCYAMANRENFPGGVRDRGEVAQTASRMMRYPKDLLSGFTTLLSGLSGVHFFVRSDSQLNIE